jgi:ubiquinone biosynthesis protein
MLSNVNAVLRALEKTAWELRAASDEVLRMGDEALAWKVRSARLSSTGWMLTKVLADYRAFAIYSAFLTGKKRDQLLQKIHSRAARSFFKTSVEQRGAFLKVGQLLSARPDLLPATWIEALSPLQDDAPAVPFAEVRALLEEELAAPIEERFARFDEEPVAAASIGQVHRARTLDGVEVAVKVQRPGIGELIDHDLALLELFLEGLDGILPPTDYPTIAREVREAIRAELDYSAEADAMGAAARFFAATPGVRVPSPIAPLCTPRVLTATFEPGEKITTALERLDGPGRADLLGRLLSVYLAQVLHAGRFQADPHPGNFLVGADGALVLLDFGCTRALTDEQRAGYRGLVQAFLAGDRARLGALLAELGFATQSGAPDTLYAFADALLASFRRAAAEGRFSWPTREQIFAEAGEIVEAAKRDPVVRIPAEFVLIGRVFGTLGGMFQHYRPAIDFGRYVLPWLA